MKKKSEYRAFEDLLSKVVSVPHDKIKAELEAEKKEKKKKSKPRARKLP